MFSTQGPLGEQIAQDTDDAQKQVANMAIEEKAKELKSGGADDFEVQTFRQGAREELTRQKPDIGKYKQAAQQSIKYQQQVGK